MGSMRAHFVFFSLQEWKLWVFNVGPLSIFFSWSVLNLLLSYGQVFKVASFGIFLFFVYFLLSKGNLYSTLYIFFLKSWTSWVVPLAIFCLFLYKVICHFLLHPLNLLRWKMLPSIFVLLLMCKMLPFICLWQFEGGPIWAFSLYVAYHIYHGRNHILWLWDKYLWGRGDIGATILKSFKVIASHTLKQYGPTTSHTS